MKPHKARGLFALALGLMALLSVLGALGALAEGPPAVGTGIEAGAAGALAEGLVGHWKFDIVSGTVAFDDSGLLNVGTLTPTVGGPAYTDTTPILSVPNHHALDFDGGDDYVIVDSVADEVAGGGGAWSASLWVKTPALLASGEKAGLLAVHTSGGGNVVLLLLLDHKYLSLIHI